MENAKKFFTEVAKTEEAKALFVAAKEPQTEQERIDTYVEIANKLGVQLTAEEVLAYVKAPAAEGEVDDTELEQLVGGGDHPGCKDTYKNYENCWMNDACDNLWETGKGYEDYLCSSSYAGKKGYDGTGATGNGVNIMR